MLYVFVFKQSPHLNVAIEADNFEDAYQSVITDWWTHEEDDINNEGFEVIPIHHYELKSEKE